MTHNILDQPSDPQIPIYAKKSFLQFGVSLIIYVLIASQITLLATIIGSLITGLLLMLIPLTAVVLNILGLRNGLRSIRLRENSTWRKYIGTIGNMLLLLFIVMILLVIGADVYENFVQ